MGAFKKGLIAMSIIAWLGGAALLGIGIWKTVDDETFESLKIIDPLEDDVPPLYAAAVYMMIATGALGFIIGFVGWIGALKSIDKCLLAYVIVSSILMAALAAQGSLGVAYRFEVNEDETADQMYNHLVNNYTEDFFNDSYYEAWTTFQQDNKCCGAYSFTDWVDNDVFGTGQFVNAVPESCCNPDVIANVTCQDEAKSNATEFLVLYDEPCVDALQDKMNGETGLQLGMSFGVLALNLVSTILAGVYRSKENKISPSD